VVLGALAACGGGCPAGANWAAHWGGGDPGAPPDTVAFEGDGGFHVATNPNLGRRLGLFPRQQFELDARGRGPAAGLVLGVARYGAGRPGVGRYALAPFDRDRPGGRFYAVLTRPAPGGDSVSTFFSIEGELRITRSGADTVAGTVRFVGAASPGRVDSVAPGAPRVVVIGSFRAARWYPPATGVAPAARR
jgi:hypothetical protein